MTDLEKKFLELLKTAVQNKSSDIHIRTGEAPALRDRGNLVSAAIAPFSHEEMFALCQFMMSDPNLKAHPEKCQDCDGSFEIKGLGRFRYNIFRTSGGISAVLRVIAPKVPTLEELSLPPVLKKIADASRGLVLVTGATGSGKSSTLAAMIDFINTNQSLHIVTAEDPIEFLHQQKKSRLSQREVGRDTKDYALALRSALRQDPDVILLGEIRDIETLDIALKASETGHLVFSTLHTSDAMKTIGRLISLFPPEEQSHARLRLADNLHSIICQRLIPAKDGGRIVAQEILINNLAIQDCIANEKKTSEIPEFIAKGKEVFEMQTFDQHLNDLLKDGKITFETARAYATNPTDFERNTSLTSGSATEDIGSPMATELEESLKVEQVIPEAPLVEQEVEAPPAPALNAPPKPGAPTPGTARPGLAPLPKPPTGVKIPKPPGAA